jgi:hypothetical protein
MTDAQIRHYIDVAAGPDRDPRRLAERIARACWPGGSADRLEPEALTRIRRSGPERIVAHVPVCSCRVGHCVLCN